MLNAVRAWILLSTLLVFSGWVLSAFHELNRIGYAIVFILAALTFIFWKQKIRGLKSPARLFQKFKSRFKRPAPFLFLALVLLSLIAGALYVPQNNDSNEYRIPRVWHWLSEGHWHWIYTYDSRMNVAGCGYEWLMAPLMLFFKTDRLNYLVNWVSYLMLPGLVFSVFTRLGVRPRVAWWWMWLMTSGWCYAMQASSDVNDSFGVIYALASVDLALRAREKKYLPDLWLAILSLALLTGAKQTNLPLMLPGAVAIILCWRMMISRPIATVATSAVALLVSAAPIFYFTFENTGKWFVNTVKVGSATFVWEGYNVPPFWGVIGNIYGLTIENLHPPIFLWSDKWNAHMDRFIQTPMGSHFKSFEMFGHLTPGASETNAGIGMWVFLLTIISVCIVKFYHGTKQSSEDSGIKWLRWAPFLSLLVFMAKDGSSAPARQMASYYVFLFPALLVAGGHSGLVRQKWWQLAALAAMFLTAGILVVSRERPLFPAETIILPLTQKHPQSKFLARTWESYACRLSVESQRNAFRNTIPAEEKVLGYATIRGSQEAGQWLPFGHRRVERVLLEDTPAGLQTKGIHFVLVDSSGLDYLNMTIADWTNQFEGVVIDSAEFETSPGNMAKDYLVRLNSPNTVEPLQEKKSSQPE
jgi:hypothetical protein